MLFLLFGAVLFAQEPVEVARTRTFTEGPVFDREGNLFFSHNEGIARLTPQGDLNVDWVKGAEPGYNGHKILPDGTHLVCASKKHAIWRLDGNGQFLGVAVSECEGKPLRSPNDLTLDDQGGYYFTDPGGSRESPIGTLHYVDRAGKVFLRHGEMRVPNGVVMDFKRRVLYVNETAPNRVLRFPVVAAGRLGAMSVFANLPGREGHEAGPDGLTIDGDGNVYVAHLGTGHVLVLDPAGKLTRTLSGGNYDVSNLVFGPRRMQLFITGSTGHRSKTEGRVYRLDL